MPEPLAFLNGQMIPATDLHIPVFDAGFVLGATVAEQLRTFGGRIFKLDAHLDRLFRSLELVNIEPRVSAAELAQMATELVSRNHPLLAAGDDLGLCIFITPGPYPTMACGAAPGSTVGLHTYPLPFSLFAQKYCQGDSLALPDVRHMPADVLPRELKCRSRMHYFLADKQAAGKFSGARALMLDSDGSVAETTTANVLVYRSAEGLISPPAESILPGISVATTWELAQALNIPCRQRKLGPADVAQADEVLVTSTSVCVLPVTHFEGQAIANGQPGEIFHRLLAAWCGHVGLDIAEQAKRFCQR